MSIMLRVLSGGAAGLFIASAFLFFQGNWQYAAGGAMLAAAVMVLHHEMESDYSTTPAPD